MTDPAAAAEVSRTDKRATEHAKAKAIKDAHTREQLLVLMGTSFCGRVHGPAQRLRSPSHSRALDDRRREAAAMAPEIDEGVRGCEECERKLSAFSAALLLAVLPATPTDKLVGAAKSLKSEQPMTWAAIRRANTVQLAQVLKRVGKTAFAPSDYQSMASEMLATLATRAA